MYYLLTKENKISWISKSERWQFAVLRIRMDPNRLARSGSDPVAK
jgi:hypothetical protein